MRSPGCFFEGKALNGLIQPYEVARAHLSPAATDPYGTDKLIWFEAVLSTPFASTLFTSYM
jgi:hypothetical protein